MNDKRNYHTPELYVLAAAPQDIVCSSTDYDLSQSWKSSWSE